MDVYIGDLNLGVCLDYDHRTAITDSGVTPLCLVLA
jgi:hypothetical protein